MRVFFDLVLASISYLRTALEQNFEAFNVLALQRIIAFTPVSRYGLKVPILTVSLWRIGRRTVAVEKSCKRKHLSPRLMFR